MNLATSHYTIQVVPVQELLAELEVIIAAQLNKSKMQSLQEKFLSTKEVREMFQPKMARGTVYNWTRQGILKNHGPRNGKNLYKYSELIEAMKSKTRYQRVPGK